MFSFLKIREKSIVDEVLAKNPKAVHKLLERGADPNGRDDMGCPLLCLACENDDYETMAVLLEAGADPNATARTGFKSHPLDIVISGTRERREECARLLLQHGADPNITINATYFNIHGESLLHQAARQNDVKIIHALLEHGADLNAEDAYWATPFDVARDAGCYEAAYALKAHIEAAAKKPPAEETLAPSARSVPVEKAPTPSAPPLEEEGQAAPEASGRALECSICCGGDKPMATAMCGHVYCRDCWDAQLKVSKTCPGCRRSVSNEQLIVLYT